MPYLIASSENFSGFEVSDTHTEEKKLDYWFMFGIFYIESNINVARNILQLDV